MHYSFKDLLNSFKDLFIKIQSWKLIELIKIFSFLLKIFFFEIFIESACHDKSNDVFIVIANSIILRDSFKQIENIDSGMEFCQLIFQTLLYDRCVRHSNQNVFRDWGQALQNCKIFNFYGFRALDFPVKNLIRSQDHCWRVLEVIYLNEFRIIACDL